MNGATAASAPAAAAVRGRARRAAPRPAARRGASSSGVSAPCSRSAHGVSRLSAGRGGGRPRVLGQPPDRDRGQHAGAQLRHPDGEAQERQRVVDRERAGAEEELPRRLRDDDVPVEVAAVEEEPRGVERRRPRCSSSTRSRGGSAARRGRGRRAACLRRGRCGGTSEPEELGAAAEGQPLRERGDERLQRGGELARRWGGRPGPGRGRRGGRRRARAGCGGGAGRRRRSAAGSGPRRAGTGACR